MKIFDGASLKISYDASWVHIFHQKYKTDSFFTKENVLDYQDEYKFSHLGKLDMFKYKNRFEFLLEYGNTTGCNIFSQKSNPAKESTVRDYVPKNVSFSYNFNGLARSADVNWTFIDANPGGVGNWWHAIGTYQPYNNGIPGPDPKIVDEVDLWVKVPFFWLQTCRQIRKHHNPIIIFILSFIVS